MSHRVFASAAGLAFAFGLLGCASSDWPNYRFDGLREANQRAATPVSDPSKVPTLAVRWTFDPPGGGSFRASPIIVNGRVFIGSSSGYFYALDAATGNLLWQYPTAGQPPLLGSCTAGSGPQTFGSYGIASSAATYFGSVIFGAPDPDPTVDHGNGSARLFELDQGTGALIWKSDVVAHVTGCTPDSTTELHERIANSAPLVAGRTVYVGVHDSADNPIQQGKVIAISADTGSLSSNFQFAATQTGTRGGGVWNGAATDLVNVYFTTGNTRCWNGGCQSTQPNPNYGLSMMKVDGGSGAVAWQFQPVPYDLDQDPDWAAGAAVHIASCDLMIGSVQKDGWAYGVDAATGQCRWQFPQTEPTQSNCAFPSGGPQDHGDTDYNRPAATWGDVLVLTSGGRAMVSTSNSAAGFTYLHALNACAPDDNGRVRWIAQVPHASSGAGGYALGAPTVTGGIVYVLTDQGHVVALADPSIVASTASVCSDISVPVANCSTLGNSVVPSPTVIADVALPDASSDAATGGAGLRNEVAIAGGRLFVATAGGHVYMLSP